MDITEQFINKPLTIYAKGKKREIGKITSAKVVDGNVRIVATIDDEVMKRVLGVGHTDDVESVGQVPDVTSS